MPNLAAFPAAPDETVPKQNAVSSPAGLTIERRPLATCAAIETEWRDLASRAIEPNPFCEPDFALPAAQHLVDFRDVSVLLFWDGPAAPRRLLGFVPARLRRRLLGQDELIGWNNPRLGLATPLIDIDQVERVIAALLHAPGRWGLADTQNLQLSHLDLDGPLLHSLLQVAEQTGHAAALDPAPAPQATADRPDLAALRHGLSRHGKLSFAESGSRQELRDMVEHHLALEASGSLARAGGAALQDIRESAFLRAMTRNLARSHRCRIGLLSLDDKPIAGAILIGKSPRLWLYSGTQDERFASFAPLAQLITWLGRRSRRREIIADLPGLHAVTAPQRLGNIRLSATAKAPRRTTPFTRRRAAAA
ncbi:Acetyltransferase (GNAT) domain-containing protein [Bosea sp. 62]|uniref:GNAT family N-acetyltransferase n=1 Tax=unclassified Bosea (in: a-proteobacteria) TaxID=2653178 RepID=UPI00125433D7|nr:MULTISPECIES: GNAT family N-acetyltransferase [unclassified Bosea (in: a-proteobacteria)]CAD5249769.1 Acetyltransferase (GNAT) domain-containing protein [Bosea sp. 46]CAD5250390.1 Acetyltransferase (GNAT) domain-containing protein [Bosea sp. 21B]CAD5264464.1 Acetyltransferase (GNAT) domain-containing protein [Bosea sp. 7B]VVT44210.1 Acetyltransferase (GNAT) domain-containing protein [Bosea sp. EC-HK365B]VXB11648.1 Acetyltransferase (GNAT) domain-containing protein [Bosea sp. 29B]